jgi:hypothetical protein
MRTSGASGRDGFMMAVPVAILVIYGLWSGGGFFGVLRMLERTLWAVVNWVTHLFS